MNANHKPTIGSLLNEIMGLLWIVVKISLSHIEDFIREILNLAISQDTNTPLSEDEESIERAVNFVDSYESLDEVDGDWQRDMEQDYNNNWNGGDTNPHLNHKPIYDGRMDEIEDA